MNSTLRDLIEECSGLLRMVYRKWRKEVTSLSNVFCIIYALQTENPLGCRKSYIIVIYFKLHLHVLGKPTEFQSSLFNLIASILRLCVTSWWDG